MSEQLYLTSQQYLATGGEAFSIYRLTPAERAGLLVMPRIVRIQFDTIRQPREFGALPSGLLVPMHSAQPMQTDIPHTHMLGMENFEERISEPTDEQAAVRALDGFVSGRPQFAESAFFYHDELHRLAPLVAERVNFQPSDMPIGNYL